MNPTLFLGLGGAGVTTLALLKRLFHQSNKLGGNVLFLFVDSDDYAQRWIKNEFAEEFDANPHFIDLATEWLSIGNFNAAARWASIKTSHTKKDRDIQSWFDPADSALIPNWMMDCGAAVSRQGGRFCLAQRYSHFDLLISGALMNLAAANAASAHLQVIPISSCCGGTGSGVFYDTLYTLHLKAIALGANLDIVPIIFGPQAYVDLIKRAKMPIEVRHLEANACAFFKELHAAFRKCSAGTDPYGSVYTGAEDFLFPSDPQARAMTLPWLPFSRSFVVDSPLEDGVSYLKPADLYRVTAEFLFYFSQLNQAQHQLHHFCPVQNCECSEMHQLRYMAVGYRVLEYPAVPLKRYVASRFAVQLIRDHLFQGAEKLSAAQLAAQAKSFLEDLLYHPEDGLGFDCFKVQVRQQYIDGTTGLLGLHFVDAFSWFDTEDEGNRNLDMNQLTGAWMGGAIEKVRDRVREMLTLVRKDSEAFFGEPSSSKMEAMYGRVRARLYEKMEEHVEKHGINSWIGETGLSDRAYVGALVEEIGRRLEAAKKALGESNSKLNELYGDTTGLQWHKAQVLEQARVFSRRIIRRRAAEKELTYRIKGFVAKLRQVVEEAFENLMIMLEVELLSYVGEAEERRHTLEYFVRKFPRQAPILEELESHSLRIRHWLCHVAQRVNVRFEKERVEIEKLRADRLKTYVPSLDDVMRADSEPGNMARDLLLQLEHGMNLQGHILRTLSELGGKSIAWRSVCATEGESSEVIANSVLAGCTKWVEERTTNDPGIKKILGCSLGEHVMWGMTLEEKSELATAVTRDKVMVFAPITAEAAKRPTFRMLIADEISGTLWPSVGLDIDDAHLRKCNVRDADYHHKAVSVKIYPLMAVEHDFTWANSLRDSYQFCDTYNPHLRRRG